jgi:glutamine---fructose-6-phosphate transaminase (isomerizing)
VAVTNDARSPLARRCDVVLPMSAGPERSIAATKTFVATVAVLLRLTAAWAKNRELAEALERLPGRLASASALDWGHAIERLSRLAQVAIIGRGPTLAIAREAALKLKEICNIHAEAFSAAEFRHGPIALVERNYPVIMFLPTDAAASGMRQLTRHLRHKDADLLITGNSSAAGACLPVLEPDHPETDPLCLIQSFYAMIPALARRLGIDVDRPRNLKKVTRTI